MSCAGTLGELGDTAAAAQRGGPSVRWLCQQPERQPITLPKWPFASPPPKKRQRPGLCARKAPLDSKEAVFGVGWVRGN